MVEGQLDALRRRDFEAAYAFASEGFQAGADLERFTAIITDGFPLLLEAAEHDTQVCLTTGEQTTLQVTVVGRSGERGAFLYLLVREGGRWRVGAASPLGSGDEVAAAASG